MLFSTPFRDLKIETSQNELKSLDVANVPHKAPFASCTSVDDVHGDKELLIRCLRGESLLLVSSERYLIVLKHCLQTYEKTRMLTAPFGLPVSSVFGLPFECFNPLYSNE